MATISFSKKEIEALQWIIPMYKSTHEDTWDKGEAKIINKLIDKIDLCWAKQNPPTKSITHNTRGTQDG